MKLLKITILLTALVLLASCSVQKTSTYKGKYRNGMFGVDSKTSPVAQGMHKKKKRKKANIFHFNWQNR